MKLVYRLLAFVMMLWKHEPKSLLKYFSYAIHDSEFKDNPVSPVSSSNLVADTTWEFTYGLEGWAEATTTEMNADVYHMGGEMRIKVLSSSSSSGGDASIAHIDSPLMSLPIGERETFVLRYRFDGPSKYAKIRLRGDFNAPHPASHDFMSWGGDGNMDDGFIDLYFPIVGDGLWHIGYSEIENKQNRARSKLNGKITQIRLWPGYHYNDFSIPPVTGNSFHVDWIRLIRAPVINRVTGCAGEKYFQNDTMTKPEFSIRTEKNVINDGFHQSRTVWMRGVTSHPYALTYNCIWQGNEKITLEGHNFGHGGVNGSGAPAHVFIDGQPCTYVRHDTIIPQQKITCLTPKYRKDFYHTGFDLMSLVEIRNGKLTGLTHSSTLLKYARPPPKPTNIILSNFASRSIDISWQPGGSVWDHMTYTGFIIRWKEEKNISDSWSQSMVTGNITTTTIRGLLPNTTYVFGISGLNEDQNSKLWYNLDLYGRRKIIDDAIEGPVATTTGHTLEFDIEFQFFNANSTQNHGPLIESASVGPTSIDSGEGHYGLVLVGHANIQNCNSSSFCCDSYDVNSGSCRDESTLVCMATNSPRSTTLPSFNDNDNTILPGNGKIVTTFNDSLVSRYYQDLFDAPCGPVLRLTVSEPHQVGAAWYPRQVEVGEGFETNFTFRITNPSLRCNNMEDAYTHCRSRGGDGLAFVIQGEGLNSLGHNGKSLGYGGINNSLAIEFDTYYNYEEHDPYENHISIHTRGWRHPVSQDHVYSLGHTNNIPDLTDGIINIRIKYEPYFDLSHISKPSFATFPYMTYFLENDQYHSGGLGDWGYEGLGLIHVYCQNLVDPVLTVPLHLAKTLKLNRGRAWVGFTAATGDETFQVHDVLKFTFSSLRLDGKTEF